MEKTRDIISTQEEIPDRIEIPEVTYHGDDRKLKERVSKFKAGTFRIVVFTIVGLFMGYYSHTYVTDTFFPTKLITAIPYKITEAIYESILPVSTRMPREFQGYGLTGSFFPYSAVACLLAEPVTTILIAGAIYGSLAYFTGDKRVFTLQRFLKFAGCWCALILVVIGAAFGVNAKARADNESLKGEMRFFLYDERGWGSSPGYYDGNVVKQFSDALRSGLVPAAVEREEGELPLGIYFDNDLRYGLYWVNYDMGYLATEEGRTYRISEEFVQLAKDYLDRKLPSGGEMEEEVK